MKEECLIYKQVIEAASFPNNLTKLTNLKNGDSFFIRDTNTVKIGDNYKKYPARIVQIFYEPKKWWQFWKRKKQLGYIVKWEE